MSSAEREWAEEYAQYEKDLCADYESQFPEDKGYSYQQYLVSRCFYAGLPAREPRSGEEMDKWKMAQDLMAGDTFIDMTNFNRNQLRRLMERIRPDVEVAGWVYRELEVILKGWK